jgi:hypothetical protein
MTRNSLLATSTLLALLALTSMAQAQTSTAPNAAAQARLAKLKAKQDAIIAAAKANAAAATAAAAKPVVTTTPVVAPPKATAAPVVTAPAASVKPAASVAPATTGSAAPAVALPAHTDTATIALDLDALKKTRPDRRHAEFLDLQARFGGLLSDPRATAELKQHAQRIAYLQRVRALGVKAKDANFVKGVDALITTEETRDANALNSFRTGALPVLAAAPAAATAVAVPVATAPAAGAAK